MKKQVFSRCVYSYMNNMPSFNVLIFKPSGSNGNEGVLGIPQRLSITEPYHQIV